MKTTLYIDVDKLISLTTLEYELAIYDITSTNIEWTGSTAEQIGELTLQREEGHIVAECNFVDAGTQITLNDSGLVQLYEDDEGVVCIDDHIIIVTGDVDFEHSVNVQTMIANGIVRLEGGSANLIYLYSLNSEKNVVNKSLILRGVISGEFRSQINIKTPLLVIQKVDVTFNYVYISSLNRYYYVDSVDLLKNTVTLSLSEDVLMSHKDLILTQTAFIERQESEFSPDVVDNNYILDYEPDITFTELTFAEYNIFNFSISSSTYGSYVITVVSTLP